MEKNKSFRIGIDLLGAESSPNNFLYALFDFARSMQEPVEFYILATPDLQPLFEEEKKKNTSSCLFHFFSVSQTIHIDEAPLQAIKKKKDSSIYKGIELLLDEKIDSFVSAGNTGALMSLAFLMLPKLPQISRLALLALMPTKKTPFAILDVGANLSVKTSHLIEFAKMGYAFQKFKRVLKPKIGLLNIGSEEGKGSPSLRDTYQQLQQLEKTLTDLQFYGNIEGKEVFQGVVDVIVTDGFTGNVLLKTAEGIANFVFDKLDDSASKKDLVESKILLKDVQHLLHYAEYPGAILMGTEKIIIKCHSYSSPHAFTRAVMGAIEFCREDFISSMKKILMT